MIHYNLSFDTNKHMLRVRLRVDAPTPKGQIFRLPCWTPGSYCIRDYARHIVQISAKDCATQKSISIDKINNNTWVCEEAQQLEVQYQIYAFDQSVRGCFIDSDRVFINGSTVFIEIDGFHDQPIEVELEPSAEQARFQVATQLTPKAAEKWGWGTYSAQDYARLLDCPITIGEITFLDFQVDNKTHTIALTGTVLGDLDKLKNDVQKICQTQSDLFADSLPFDSYLFLLHLLEDGYGGLEHSDSTALIAAIQCMPIDKTDKSKYYQLLLGLFSHEYFHAWNVKRIKPDAFMPYDLNKPNYTRLLWVFEGFTSYYDDLGLVRSGTISAEDYLNTMAKNITRVIRGPGRHVQSLVDSSFDAWTKFYFPNENTPNQGVSYYVKGAVVAYLMDIMIRVASEHQKSLDDVMRQLWENYGKAKIGLTDEAIHNILVEMGVNPQFIQEAIYGTDELPIEKILSSFGLALEYKPRLQVENFYPEATSPLPGQGVFGWQLEKLADKVKVVSVFHKGAAIQAGISPKDDIVAINNIKTTIKSYDAICKRLKVEEVVTVTLFRENILKTIKVTLKQPELDVASIQRIENNTEVQNKIIDDWLMGS
tara:strand:+ start:53812 stop:55596 length:1785 start_codon:yes stop_codon:yes gene_type:complete